jgi:hypothetical protein
LLSPTQQVEEAQDATAAETEPETRPLSVSWLGRWLGNRRPLLPRMCAALLLILLLILVLLDILLVAVSVEVFFLDTFLPVDVQAVFSLFLILLCVLLFPFFGQTAINP